MPNIVIKEQDLTTPGRVAESFEVVYIPGFVDTDQDCLYSWEYKRNENGDIERDAKTGKPLYAYKDKKKYIGLEKGKPQLFTSVAEFETMCGKKPATFKTRQNYADLITEKCVGFDINAQPMEADTAFMFEEGDADPSYIMAKELLASGLNVMYERVNSDEDDIAPDFSEIFKRKHLAFGDDNAEWEKICENYKEVTLEDTYHKVSDEFSYIPTYEKELENGKIFYRHNIIYVLVETKPFDFAQTYNEYFVLDNNGNYVPNTSDKFEKDKIYEATVNGENEFEKIESESEPYDWEETCFDCYFREYKLKDTTKKTDLEADLVKMIGDVSIVTMYSQLPRIFDSGNIDGLMDRGNYNIKYLTSGGYPTFEYNKNSIVSAMMTFAETRGDCYALIDHTDVISRESNIGDRRSVYGSVHSCRNTTFNADNATFATMFTPWAEYARITSDKDTEFNQKTGTLDTDISKDYDATIRFSGTFAYLTSLADSIETNAPWLAIAGAARGGVRNLTSNGMTTVISNGAADGMQPRQGIAVNAITNIKPYGNIIWGNRTLKNNAENLTATSFLNIRNLVCDVKKVVYQTARRLTFEQNDDVLWVNFKAGIAPTLQRMLSGAGISNYKIVRDYENEHAAEKGVVCAKIFLYPIYPVEDFYITVVLKDDEIIVE